MDIQFIPLILLGLYLLYISYYYATPMFFLKVMLFVTHIRYRDVDVRFEESRITVRFSESGEERVVVQPIDEELESRFWAMTVCSVFHGLLRDIRKGKWNENVAVSDENDGE